MEIPSFKRDLVALAEQPNGHIAPKTRTPGTRTVRDKAAILQTGKINIVTKKQRHTLHPPKNIPQLHN
jgi:hypothetical protein